jgi:hypothetical protein
MKEEEWLTSHDSSRLLACLQIADRPRSLRLFGCACCRLLSKWTEDDRLLDAIDAAERFADSAIVSTTLDRWATRIRKRWPEEFTSEAQSILYSSVIRICIPDTRFIAGILDDALQHLASHRKPAIRDKYRTQIELLLRDIFGNPFRPVSLDQEWRTSTAIAIAQQMYDARDFSAMPILADALQDAGCDNEDVLDHCRAADGVHVRGCWVVDLVLGKS